MSESTWAQTITGLKKELVSMESDSHRIGQCLEIIPREAESLKLEVLKYTLEKRRVAIARQRGLTSVVKDRRKMGTSLTVAATGLVLAGLITKDNYAALNAGLSSFNGILQGLGETEWAVLLGNELVVAPSDAIPLKGTWVTWKSLISAIDDLRAEALQGKQLGTLQDVIQKLQQSKGKLIYLILLN